MSPVSLAGAIAQQNAEALFLVALAQIVRPGAPMVYGAFTSNVDMRTGSPAFGTPESVKRQFASGQMARRYGLPWRSSNATASNVVDAQAAYEAEMAVWGAVMGGVNLLYQGAGWLEGGLTASYEKLILDAEILQMMAEVLQPLDVDEAIARLRRDRRRRAGRPLLRHGPHARALRDGVLPADPVRLAQLRDVAGGRRADGDRAGQRRSGSGSSPRPCRRRSIRRSPRPSMRSSSGAGRRSRQARTSGWRSRRGAACPTRPVAARGPDMLGGDLRTVSDDVGDSVRVAKAEPVVVLEPGDDRLLLGQALRLRFGDEVVRDLARLLLDAVEIRLERHDEPSLR